MNKKAFTLVELIVVIVILAILGTISFISLQNYSSSARDVKRSNDIRNLISKVSIESAKGVNLSKLISSGSSHTGNIYGTDDTIVIGTPNFGNLNENENNFKDPKTKNGYLMAYSVKTKRVAGMYKSETTGRSVCVGEVQLFSGTEWECGENLNNQETACKAGVFQGNTTYSSTTDLPNGWRDLEVKDCNGNVLYTIMDRNLGTSESYNGTEKPEVWGNYYQWGNNYGFPSSGDITISSTRVDASSYGPGNYYNSDIFIGSTLSPSGWITNWSSSKNANLWGGSGDTLTSNGPGTNEDRKGACPNGYHIPSTLEWEGLFKAWCQYRGGNLSLCTTHYTTSTGNGGTQNGIDWEVLANYNSTLTFANFQNDLLLTLAGFLAPDNAIFWDDDEGTYQSSSLATSGPGCFGGPNGSNVFNLFFDSSSLAQDCLLSTTFGFPIRCFKN